MSYTQLDPIAEFAPGGGWGKAPTANAALTSTADEIVGGFFCDRLQFVFQEGGE